MKESEQAAAEAATQLAAALRLPAASGTARNIVDAIVRAAVARIAEQKLQAYDTLAGNDDHSTLAANHRPDLQPIRPPLGLPGKGRK